MKDSIERPYPVAISQAIVKISDNGNTEFASLTLRMRLIKGLLASGIDIIYIIDPKNTFTSTSSEIVSHIRVIRGIAAIKGYVQPSDRLLLLRDDILYRDTFLKTVIHSDMVEMQYLSQNGHEVASLRQSKNLDTGAFENHVSVTVEDMNFHHFQREEDRKALTKKLYSWLAKETDGFSSIYFNRPISNLITKACVNMQVSPYFYTAGTALLAVIMVMFLFSGRTDSILFGGLLYHAASVFDGVDGEIARLKYLSSKNGAIVDTAVDMATNIMYMTGLGYALVTLHGEQYFWMSIYSVTLVICGVLAMTTVLYFGPKGGSFDILAKVIRKRIANNPSLDNLFNNINYAFKRDSFALLFAILGVLGLETTIPSLLLFGLAVWNLTILINAPHIITNAELYKAK